MNVFDRIGLVALFVCGLLFGPDQIQTEPLRSPEMHIVGLAIATFVVEECRSQQWIRMRGARSGLEEAMRRRRPVEEDVMFETLYMTDPSDAPPLIVVPRPSYERVIELEATAALEEVRRQIDDFFKGFDDRRSILLGRIRAAHAFHNRSRAQRDRFERVRQKLKGEIK